MRKARDIASHATKQAASKAKATRTKGRVSGTEVKTFEALSNAEKDALLKQLFVQNGLIQDSD